MNTHDKIELPPLPEWSKMDNLANLVPSEIRQCMAEYARAAVELNLQGRGEPVAWITKNDLRNVQDESFDAVAYWRPKGHVAEPDELPLYLAPQQPTDPAAWYALLQAAEEMSQASHVLAGTDERNRLLRAIEAAKAQQPAKAMAVVTNVPVPSEQQIIEAAERAGLWPNTVRNWIPQFKRYHEIIARHGQPAQPADMEDVYIDEKGFVWNQPSAAVYARVAKAYNALIYESGQRKGAQPAASVKPEQETCERCQGNGEIITDWDRYMHPRRGDKGDEAVAECPDCDGSGKVDAPVATQPSVPDHLIKRLLKHAENKENTAFARSAMREVVQYLSTPPAEGQAQQDADKADSARLDWLEHQINTHGAIHLHDGLNLKGHGLGLRPGSAVRTLREAIDAARTQQSGGTTE